MTLRVKSLPLPPRIKRIAACLPAVVSVVRTAGLASSAIGTPI